MTEARIDSQGTCESWGSTFAKEEDGGIAQLGEHLLCKQGVRSSNLLTSTKEGCITRVIVIKQSEEEEE